MNSCPSALANPSPAPSVGGGIAVAVAVAVVAAGVAWWWMDRQATQQNKPPPSTTKGVPEWLRLATLAYGQPTPPHLRGLPAMALRP